MEDKNIQSLEETLQESDAKTERAFKKILVAGVAMGVGFLAYGLADGNEYMQGLGSGFLIGDALSAIMVYGSRYLRG